MSNKILIIDTYYPEFVKKIYQANATLAQRSYQEQLIFLLQQNFGTGDYYSRHLNDLGWEATDIIADIYPLQLAWAKEHGLKFFLPGKLGRLVNLYRILLAQVKFFKPDILYMQNLGFCPPFILKLLKRYAKRLVGQIACPLPPELYLRPYDLILTSFPHFVTKLNKLGIKSQYFKIGFEASILEKVKPAEKKYDVIFIGGFAAVHQKGTEALEKIARQVKIDVWGYGIENVPADYQLRKNYHGEAWGIDMYKIINQAKICINRHSSAAENYANNMRLFEVTGMGTLLITDAKDNLAELFIPNKEIVVYHDEQELLEKVQFYLAHDSARAEIALAGQKRTLKEHTYKARMQELDKILKQYLCEQS